MLRRIGAGVWFDEEESEYWMETDEPETFAGIAKIRREQGVEFPLIRVHSYNLHGNRWLNTCAACTFLGRYEQFDLYYCVGFGSKLPTFVARFGPGTADYVAGWSFASAHSGGMSHELPYGQDALKEAHYRAMRRGLLEHD